MTIRSKLLFIILVAALLTIVVASASLYISRTVSESQKDVLYSSQFISKISDFLLLTQEFAIQPSPRILQQSNITYAWIRKRLKSISPGSATEQGMINELISHLNTHKTLFDRISSLHTDAQSVANVSTQLRLNNALKGRLLVESGRISDTTSELRNFKYIELQEYQRNGQQLLVLVFIASSVIVIFIAYMVLRSIERPIAALKDEARIISRGNFQHPVVTSGNDEISDLARSLESMRESLLESTISKNQLESYVDERTAELKEAREQADAANQAKSKFLTRMSHELRTPLNSILGFAQLMDRQDTINPEVLNSYIDQILQSGWHLLSLVDDVLDLASIEANRLELSMTVISTDKILRECMVTMQPLAQKENITLTYTVEENSRGLPVKADSLRFKQVLLNLLSNAIKYNHEGGSVSVVCEQLDTGYERINVTDTGTGIAFDDQAALFEPFSQLYLDTYAPQGSGIGLSISKQLVELMGGSIGVKSQPGKGSTFWVDLELAQQVDLMCEVESTLTSPERDEVAGEQHHTLLYIEDSPSHIRLLQAIVGTMPNLGLLTAHTPMLGLELAAAHKPDLILLDICLPGMDGYEVLNNLQEHEALHNIPVIAISASAMPQEFEKGLRAGFRRYLTKPVDITEFKKCVNELVADSRDF